MLRVLDIAKLVFGFITKKSLSRQVMLFDVRPVVSEQSI